ncbi:PP2C family serine/threonine-protein phosphatase [Geobacillus stearothermophilus]|uniref:PP2C family serine/threonine-protein phosphatase n=1 Tax=Geobacillus stearothermophilus TaxID=1422 RepID=UPI0009F9BF08|nr:Uncharacterised protein [[Flavobacterium] thermophilum]STO36101.1 Uncharacterised protein [[Flavobacterium] thermophilum]
MSDIGGTHQKIYNHSAYGCYTIVSVQGASHVKNQQPCQDAFACLEDSETGGPLIIAIADGHGDKRHDMSHYGAKLATHIAVHVLKDLYEQLKQSRTYLFRSFRDDFLKEVVKQWKKEVLAHASAHDIDGTDPSKVYTRYGTTLLVALVCEEEALVGQIGDGDILVIDGKNRPIPSLDKGDDLVGNATYSLCSPEANRFWNAARIPRPLGNKFLMMSTDGLSNCFEDDDNFYKFASSLAEYVDRHTFSSASDAFPSLLFTYSSRGSGDDITLALLKFKNISTPHMRPDTQEETRPSDTMEEKEPAAVLEADEERDKSRSLESGKSESCTYRLGPLSKETYRKAGGSIYKPVSLNNDKLQGPIINIRPKDELQ